MVQMLDFREFEVKKVVKLRQKKRFGQHNEYGDNHKNI